MNGKITMEFEDSGKGSMNTTVLVNLQHCSKIDKQLVMFALMKGMNYDKLDKMLLVSSIMSGKDPTSDAKTLGSTRIDLTPLMNAMHREDGHDEQS